MNRSVLHRRTPLRAARRNKSLRQRLWPECSRLIRARDGRCLFAGFFGSRCGGGLQAAHLYPRGKYPLLMLYPLNVVAACYVCHLYGFHKSPLDAARWIQTKLPQAWRDQLEAMRVNHLGRKRMTEAEIRAEWRTFGLLP